MNEQEILYTIALTRINYFSLAGLLELYRRLGSATEVMEHRKNIREVIPEHRPDWLRHLRMSLIQCVARRMNCSGIRRTG